jgi:hypothetical protein
MPDMKYYIIRKGGEKTGEALGIIRVPEHVFSWSIYHRSLKKHWPAWMYQITEAEYGSYEALGLFPVFKHYPKIAVGPDFAFIYDPEFFAIRVEDENVYIVPVKFIEHSASHQGAAGSIES